MNGAEFFALAVIFALVAALLGAVLATLHDSPAPALAAVSPAVRYLTRAALGGLSIIAAALVAAVYLSH